MFELEFTRCHTKLRNFYHTDNCADTVAEACYLKPLHWGVHPSEMYDREGRIVMQSAIEDCAVNDGNMTILLPTKSISLTPRDGTLKCSKWFYNPQAYVGLVTGFTDTICASLYGKVLLAKVNERSLPMFLTDGTVMAYSEELATTLCSLKAENDYLDIAFLILSYYSALFMERGKYHDLERVPLSYLKTSFKYPTKQSIQEFILREDRSNNDDTLFGVS